MKSLEDYKALAAENYGHRCPGQVLGVRMAMRGLRRLGIGDPAKDCKRLLTFVEKSAAAPQTPSVGWQAVAWGTALFAATVQVKAITSR
jgi:formylmethanofuran dehydrogenase subunit E